MGVLRRIKEKIATIEAYLRSNNAMKSVAAVRINKYKKKAKVLEEINKINFYKNPKKTGQNKKTMHVIIGCNQGMCGIFFNKVSNYIKKTVKESVKNDFIFILGEKFLDYNVHENIKVERLVLTDVSFLNLVLKNLEDIMRKRNITDVFLHYYDKKGMKNELIVENLNSNEDVCIYKVLCIMNKIMRCALVSGFYENKERVLALEQAKGNAEKMQKKGYNELNRVRQDTITNDLAEIVAGVL